MSIFKLDSPFFLCIRGQEEVESRRWNGPIGLLEQTGLRCLPGILRSTHLRCVPSGTAMMIGAPFEPRPGELIYSALARVSDAMAYPRIRSLLLAAFGTSTGIAIIDLPGRVQSLAENLFGLSPPEAYEAAHQLIRCHTTLPYFVPFIPQERGNAALQAMLTSHGGTLHSRLGIRASTVPMPSRLRYCQACVADDRLAFEDAYWHREHQLPGVLVCHSHGCQLTDSRVCRSSSRDRLVFISLESVASDHDPPSAADLLPVAAPAWLIDIAEDTAWLLRRGADTCAEGSADLENLRCRHLALFQEAGFLCGGGSVRQQRLRKAIIEKYGEPFLGSIGCQLSPTGADDWLAKLVRAGRGARHPLQHMLVSRLLESSIKQLLTYRSCSEASRQPSSTTVPVLHVKTADAESVTKSDSSRFDDVWHARLRALVDDCSVSLREIGRRLGADPRTVQRRARKIGAWRPEWTSWDRSAPAVGRINAARATRARQRKVWLRLLRQNPSFSVTQLRGVKPATYSYLYRYDRMWLANHYPPASATKKPQQSSRIDWMERDREMREAAGDAVNALLAESGRPTKIRPATIARRMGELSLLQQKAHLLPATTAYMVRATETDVDYARRKIEWLRRSLAAASEAPPKHVFVRSAGLRPHLVSALSLEIDEAVRFLQRRKRQFPTSSAFTDTDEVRQSPSATAASAAGDTAYVRRSR